MRETGLHTKVSEEREGEGVPSAGAEIPLQALEQTVVSLAVALQPMEVHREQGSTCSLWRTHPTTAVDTQRRL